MIVTCPSCQTRFNLDAAKLQPVGRHVRCAKCSHRWLQLPEGMEPPAGLMPPASDEPETQPEPQAVPESATAVPESPAVAAPEAAATPESVAAEPAAAEAPAPEAPAEAAQSPAAPADQAAADAVAEKPIPKLEPPSGRLRLGNRATGPITVPPLMRPARPARRGSGLGLLLIAGVIIGLLVAAFVFRDVIARKVPGADAIYALLHLSTDNPAKDLEISVGPYDARGGTLSVTATVFNQSEYPVDVPPLMIVPVDENGQEMEPILFRLRERVAEPGQNIKFQKSFDNWPATAKSFVLRTADAP